MAQAIGRFENRSSRPNRGMIAIGRALRSADGYEDLALRLLSARRFFIISDDRFLPAAVRRRPRHAAEPWPFPALWHLILPHLRHDRSVNRYAPQSKWKPLGAYATLDD
jgi:hypothetical protein